MDVYFVTLILKQAHTNVMLLCAGNSIIKARITRREKSDYEKIANWIGPQIQSKE